MTRLPHWVFIRNTLPDQDTVVNVKQVRSTGRGGKEAGEAGFVGLFG